MQWNYVQLNFYNVIKLFLLQVAHDDEFLEHTLRNTLEVDDFTAKLYDIWMKVREEGITQVKKSFNTIIGTGLYGEEKQRVCLTELLFI